MLLAAGQRGASGRRYDPQDPLEVTALSLALMRLPLAQRQVLVLYYLADLPVDDIARDCGISVGTVKATIFAAKTFLRSALAKKDIRKGSTHVLF